MKTSTIFRRWSLRQLAPLQISSSKTLVSKKSHAPVVVLNSIHPEGQRRQPPAVTAQPPTAQPPAASRQPPAVCRHSRQPPSHLKVEISCFEFVYK
jgi:hypothetical protein